MQRATGEVLEWISNFSVEIGHQAIIWTNGN